MSSDPMIAIDKERRMARQYEPVNRRGMPPAWEGRTTLPPSRSGPCFGLPGVCGWSQGESMGSCDQCPIGLWMSAI
jgi:hypothetical protein